MTMESESPSAAAEMVAVRTDAKEVHGVAWTGIENASPEIKALSKPRMDASKLPFDPLEYVEHLDQLPFDPSMDPDMGQ